MKRLGIAEPKKHSWYIILLALFSVAALGAGCRKSEQGVGATATAPKTFASPDDASQALYQATKSGDEAGLIAIFGSDAKDLVISGDPVQDKAARDKFAADYDEMHRWGKLTNDRKVLNVGADNYPFPFPLLRNASGQWYFDSKSAKDEILARRIGDNELAAIEVLNAMSDAEIEYFSQTHDGNPVHQFAQKFVSDDGKQNGLYWKVTGDEPESPLGPLAANASAEGYGGAGQQTPQPFHGYFYRILTRQGEHAAGGAKNYIVNGNMTAGFAILAYPADYRNSGVMTLIINQDGPVFQKDLGEKTADLAKAITEFNPDDTWSPVQ